MLGLQQILWENFLKMKRVLVVEDELSMRETLKCLMIRWNYDVTLSESVQEAKLCILNQPAFDLVVSDFLLPDGNGKQFFHWLREDCSNEVPFLMVSGNYTPQPADSFQFISKPFNIKQLRLSMDCMCGMVHNTMATG